MIVKGQLKDAQLEIAADNTARDALTPRKARVVFVASSNKMYIGNGTSWSNIGDASALGDIKASMLDEATYHSEFGAEWIIADGRSVIGSDYNTLTGQSNVPDLRGTFLRGKDGTRGLNPDGDLSLGAYSGDKLGTHTHSYSDATVDLGSSGGAQQSIKGNSTSSSGSPFIHTFDADTTRTTVPAGDNETSPKSVTINYFIKINRDLGL